jgi:serine/threonine protein kinase
VDGADLEALMKNPSLCPALRSPEKRMTLAVGICKGTTYLHNLRTPFLHGSFKPSDVLVPAKTLQPKIANFGLWDFKKYFVENTLPEQAYPSIMTNPWQAPEVLLGQERPTIFADIWSVAATLLQWLTEQSNPWDMQDLCTRYKMRHNREMAALMKAMENQEEPSVLTLLTDFDTENHGLNVMRIALNYRPTERPPVRKIEEELEIASRTPTWTNLAYQKYYGK